MDDSQWERLKQQGNYFVSCTACSAIALLDAALLNQAREFESYHNTIPGHGIDHTALRKGISISEWEEVYLATASYLRGLKSISFQEMNSQQTRK